MLSNYKENYSSRILDALFSCNKMLFSVSARDLMIDNEQPFNSNFLFSVLGQNKTGSTSKARSKSSTMREYRPWVARPPFGPIRKQEKREPIKE